MGHNGQDCDTRVFVHKEALRQRCRKHYITLEPYVVVARCASPRLNSLFMPSASRGSCQHVTPEALARGEALRLAQMPLKRCNSYVRVQGKKHQVPTVGRGVCIKVGAICSKLPWVVAINFVVLAPKSVTAQDLMDTSGGGQHDKAVKSPTL